MQILCAEQRKHEVYSFYMSEHQPATLTLDWTNHKAIVNSDDIHTTLNNISKDFVMAWDELGNTDITFKDFNFDGYTDIAITFSAYLTGYNSCYDYYFFDVKKKVFDKTMAHICNLDVSQKEHILHAHMKDGLIYKHTYYQIDAEGKPFLFLQGENHVTKVDFSPVQYTSSEVKVQVKRAYFYDIWDGKRLKSYLIKGDKVKVLETMSTIDGVWWIKVSYKGKKKIYRYWLRLSDLVFKPMKRVF
jgi:hypothetical protein